MDLQTTKFAVLDVGRVLQLHHLYWCVCVYDPNVCVLSLGAVSPEVMVKVYVVDLRGDSIAAPVSVRAYLNQTISEFKQLIAQVAVLPRSRHTQRKVVTSDSILYGPLQPES